MDKDVSLTEVFKGIDTANALGNTETVADLVRIGVQLVKEIEGKICQIEESASTLQELHKYQLMVRDAEILILKNGSL